MKDGIDPSNIVREETKLGGRYYYRLHGAEAELTFVVSEGVMSIDHTGVPKSLGGRGVGLALVRRAVEDARKSGLKINPVCPFVGAMARRYPEMQDVVSTS